MKLIMALPIQVNIAKKIDLINNYPRELKPINHFNTPCTFYKPLALK